MINQHQFVNVCLRNLQSEIFSTDSQRNSEAYTWIEGKSGQVANRGNHLFVYSGRQLESGNK